MTKIPRKVSSIVLIAILMASLVVGVAFAANIVIDSFNVAEQNLLVDPGTASDSGFIDNVAILGGERDAELTWNSGLGEARIRIDRFNTNEMQFSQEPGVASNASVVWDGNDDDATTLDATGLGGIDLTDTSTNDGFQIRVTFTDLAAPIRVIAYTDGSNWSDYSFTVPAGILTGQSVALFFPFADFTTQAGTGADFTNIGAIVLEVDGDSSPGSDLSLDFFQVNDFRDYGDVSTAYAVATRRANHMPLGLRLGTNVDNEPTDNANANALGDDTDGSPDDEDGVAPTPAVAWVTGTNGGSIDITVTGCTGTCRLNGWIDWDDDGDFVDTGDSILVDTAVTNGNSTITFDIPGTAVLADGIFFARFRLCPTTGVCNSITAQDVSNGEIEDYRWSFGPTAVTLVDLTATANNAWTLPAAVALGLVVLLLGGLVLYRRRGAAV